MLAILILTLFHYNFNTALQFYLNINMMLEVVLTLTLSLKFNKVSQTFRVRWYRRWEKSDKLQTCFRTLAKNYGLTPLTATNV